ncbi:MAG: hypothetical protein JO061_13120 [Acidobacteriaceae bacterium]|nr:hypothetical protein [Acidobacteriaceae bacterium]
MAASIAVSAVVGVLCIASHTPFQANEYGLARLAISQRSSAVRGWTAVHVLAAGCACSRKVAEHLIARGRVAGLRDAVVLVGQDPEVMSKLQLAGIATEYMSPEDAANRFHLRGAPWLMFVDSDGKVRYAGGYSSTRDVRDGYQDLRIWSTLRSGGTLAALPAYGCAIGQQMQARIDPFGLKYGKLGSFR